MLDVVDAQCAHQLRLCAHLQFYGRDAMRQSVPVVASDRDPAHDPNLSASNLNFPVESLKEPLFSAITTQHFEPNIFSRSCRPAAPSGSRGWSRTQGRAPTYGSSQGARPAGVALALGWGVP